MKKGLIGGSLILLCTFSFFCAELIVFAQDSDDPTVTLPSDQEIESLQSEAVLYTAEAFEQLADDRKKEVYYSFPEILPPAFDPAVYRDLLHSNPEYQGVVR